MTEEEQEVANSCSKESYYPPSAYRLLSDSERTIPKCTAEERRFFNVGEKLNVRSIMKKLETSYDDSQSQIS